MEARVIGIEDVVPATPAVQAGKGEIKVVPVPDSREEVPVEVVVRKTLFSQPPSSATRSSTAKALVLVHANVFAGLPEVNEQLLLRESASPTGYTLDDGIDVAQASTRAEEVGGHDSSSSAGSSVSSSDSSSTT
jgi:hypothetical protein